MLQPDLILVHGVFYAGAERIESFGRVRNARPTTPKAVFHARKSAFSQHAEALGVCNYEWLDSSGRGMANKGLRKMRGTAPAVDAVEIIALNREALCASLAQDAGKERWREIASCKPQPFDTARSFILMGKPIQQLEGPGEGQRVIWFGNGLEQLSREEFIAHYTRQHGPLVAGHAQQIGLRRYRQVPDEEKTLCESLRKLGFGQAPPPAVFGELVMGMPAIKLSALRGRRVATREIEADEKQHIDFSRSMLLLPGRPRS